MYICMNVNTIRQWYKWESILYVCSPISMTTHVLVIVHGTIARMCQSQVLSTESIVHALDHIYMYIAILKDVIILIQWNPSKVETIGTKNFVCCSEVSLAQGLVVDHAPPTVAANYDKAQLWTTKKTIDQRSVN